MNCGLPWPQPLLRPLPLGWNAQAKTPVLVISQPFTDLCLPTWAQLASTFKNQAVCMLPPPTENCSSVYKARLR